MKTFYYSITILFLFHLLSCKKKNESNMYETISINVEAAIPVDIKDSLHYNIKEISLELTDNSLLTYIEELQITNNEIIVYDKHRLMAFDIFSIS